jgi:hypothetical protein
VYMNFVLASVFSFIYLWFCMFHCYVCSIANAHSLLLNNWNYL